MGNTGSGYWDSATARATAIKRADKELSATPQDGMNKVIEVLSTHKGSIYGSPVIDWSRERTTHMDKE